MPAWDVAALAATVVGAVAGPGDDAYTAECATCNLSVPRRPAVVVGATSAADVSAAVRFAAERDLPAGGLATGHGVSVPPVGVVGYSLGGGLSPTLGRSRGWAADRVTAIELVTADGQAVRATADRHRDLFWAARAARTTSASPRRSSSSCSTSRSCTGAACTSPASWRRTSWTSTGRGHPRCPRS